MENFYEVTTGLWGLINLNSIHLLRSILLSVY